jgi:hypothetical protein
MAFNLFEVCFGMYLPALGVIRGKLLPEESRTTLMHIIKIPSYFSGGVTFLYMTQIENSGSEQIWLLLTGLLAVSWLCSVLLKNLTENTEEEAIA